MLQIYRHSFRDPGNPLFKAVYVGCQAERPHSIHPDHPDSIHILPGNLEFTAGDEKELIGADLFALARRQQQSCMTRRVFCIFNLPNLYKV